MLQQERGGWLQPSAEEEEEEEEDEEEVKDRSQPRWTVWLDVEPSREAAHWLPWRPDKAKGQSEVDCEDPDRQVGVHNVSRGNSITVCENKTLYTVCVTALFAFFFSLSLQL
ncbi:Protein NRDE2 [Liparis tanakae]|uniref:Protein NRDE2 n=1 Tax=Liparis tanakae TaxID=230148 RepID=A0A4Z2E0I2_9TELE|nr:Protein NRDE2 [Liparis tanakae]